MDGGAIDSTEGRLLPWSQSLLSGSWEGVVLTQEAAGPAGVSVLPWSPHSSLWRVILRMKCLNGREALDCGGC